MLCLVLETDWRRGDMERRRALRQFSTELSKVRESILSTL
jgi:hypothetical protein